nr:MAG TPA: hypothetical protein [Caudoviricetes sp.]
MPLVLVALVAGQMILCVSATCVGYSCLALLCAAIWCCVPVANRCECHHYQYPCYCACNP